MSPEFLGTLPGWITAFSTSGGVVTLIIAYWRRGVSLRGLEHAAEADIRDHYAQEVEGMRAQMLALEKYYREMIAHSDRRHEECEDARLQLREELAGVKRQILQYSANRVLHLDEQCPSPAVADAARRVKDITEDKDE